MSLTGLRSSRLAPMLVAAVVLAMAWIGIATVQPASADTDPPTGTPATVSADALPTWQVNGVVWSQVTVGNTVYATGSFTTARPPGVGAGGAGQINVGNLIAYNITTGNRVTSFNHTLNAQGLTITASPDKTRVYVGGDFTAVDGVARSHIAAFDTATGALDTSFHPSLANQVAAISATNTTVYVGGSFFSASGSSRRRLAAFNAANGALLSWAPTADDNNVQAMVVTPDNSRVIIGGKFTTLNGVAANGMGSVDAITGATEPWAANQTIHDGGTGSAIDSLTTDGTQIYGSGYAFQTGDFEGAFAADPNTGNIAWLNDCHGDTYSIQPVGQVLYTVSHAHNCSTIGAFPQSNPWSINMRHALAFTTYPTGTNTGPDDYGWNYNGVPAPTLLQWFPTLTLGTYTGQNQAAWSVSGNSDYITLGGEFPSVNGTAQQGLVRFAIRSAAPDKRGPTRPPNPTTPTATSISAGTARVSWQSAYDQDNANLTYNVYRSGTAAPVYTTTAASNYWTYPNLGFIDKGLTPGSSYTYTIKVSDPDGNSLTLPKTNSVTIGSTQPSQYDTDVANDGASAFWPLGEPSGSAILDNVAFNDATAQAGVTRGAPGPISGDSTTASTFSGDSTGWAVTNSTMSVGSDFSVETWVKTTTTSGGKIVGYGDGNTADSNSYDRHIYMDNAGRIVFGVYPGSARTVTSSNTYNDGKWHYIVATLSSTTGMTLYVDGKKVATDSGTKSAQAYTGYWRIGGDRLNGWPDQPSSEDFAGSIGDVAIYPVSLGLSTVQSHFIDAGGTLNLPAKPTDAYGKAVYGDSPDLYWRLGEAQGPTANDVSPNQANGTYTGGVTYGSAGAIADTSDTAVTFDGSTGSIGSDDPVTDPTVYSEELWFKTTTTHGGKLIGLGDQQSGRSSSYDRHVYMENSGQLTFGVWTGQPNTITSPNSYNDDKWHYMVATQGPDGMTLYVDGQSVGTNPQTQAQAYTGYWRVGGDSDWGGDSPYFAGSIDEVAVYSHELAPSQIVAHFQADGGQVPNQSPVAAFTSTGSGLEVTVDGSGSSDPDGTVASYDWNWGDGTADGSGVSDTHAYAAAGTYTVKLTVTDNDGATDSVTHDVTVTNTPPTASFTTSANALKVTVDGTGSSDPDGSIASYNWHWGDGSPDSSGSTASHTYATPGNYTVELTVTDNGGATDVVSHDVNVTLSNEPPVAAFTSTTDDLKVSVDASGSNDPDGTVASYDWDWGDGSDGGTGSTTSHTYATAGTYTIKLTVTDNDGATDSISHDVTTNPVTIASDSFARTVTNGWGTADLGGAWTPTGAKSNFSVSGGVGSITMPNPGSGPSVQLNSLSVSSAEVTVGAAVPAQVTGGGVFVSVMPRSVASVGNYRAVANLRADGRVALSLVRVDTDGQATIVPSSIVPGLSVNPGQVLEIKALASGTNPTTLAAKVWVQGTSEPSDWQATGTDVSGPMQTAGSIGLMSYLSANATVSPAVVSFSGFQAVEGESASPNALAAAEFVATTDVHRSKDPALAARVSPPLGKAQVQITNK